MDEATAPEHTPPTVLRAAWGGLCPTCGQDRIWSGYLKVKPKCGVCGQDFSTADTGDGPAFFVNFAALIIFLPILFVIPISAIPIWAKVISMLVLTGMLIAFCLLSLPLVKALLLVLKIRNRAGEGQLDGEA